MRLFYHALFTGFTLFFLIFNLSCTNFFKNPEAAEIPGKQKYVTVSGTFIILDSAPPIHAYSTPSQRTAFPSMPSDDNSVYSIMAIDTADITKTYQASSITPAEKSYIINIPVTDTTKTFKIRAEKSYKKTDGTAGDFYLYGESSNFSVSPESQIKTINVTLKAHQTTTTPHAQLQLLLPTTQLRQELL